MRDAPYAVDHLSTRSQRPIISRDTCDSIPLLPPPIKSVTCWPRPPLPPPSSPAIPLHTPPKLDGKTFSLVESREPLSAISYRVADSGEQCVCTCARPFACLPTFFPSFPLFLSLSFSLQTNLFFPAKETSGKGEIETTLDGLSETLFPSRKEESSWTL